MQFDDIITIMNYHGNWCILLCFIQYIVEDELDFFHNLFKINFYHCLNLYEMYTVITSRKQFTVKCAVREIGDSK